MYQKEKVKGEIFRLLPLLNEKDHRDKIEVPDPLAEEDLISRKLNNKRKLVRLITQYRDMFFFHISEGAKKK